MDFRKWLQAEIDHRGWNYSEVGRRGDISHARISQVIKGGEPPGKVFCFAIARAFDMDPNEVLRLAGHLVPEMNNKITGNGKSLLSVYYQLSEDGKQAVYRFASWQLEKEDLSSQ